MAAQAAKVVPTKLPDLFHFGFERNPRPINIATLFTTSMFADPGSRHPFHIRTVRRLKDFDATKLHWRVSSPMDLSKSGFVRDKAAKRVRQAFKDELKHMGWDAEGRRLPQTEETVAAREFDLSGAIPCPSRCAAACAFSTVTGSHI
jgi:hypothetical protein